MQTSNALNLDGLPSLEECLAHPRLIEARKKIADAENVLTTGSSEQRYLRVDEYRLKKQENTEYYYRLHRTERHLERLLKKVKQRPWNWLLGEDRQRAIMKRHQKIKSKKFEAYEKNKKDLDAEYSAEAHIDQAMMAISSAVGELSSRIRENLASQFSEDDRWVDRFTSSRMFSRELSNILWRELGLTRYQESGQLTNPQHVENWIIGHGDGTSHSETRIKTEPEYEVLLDDLTAKTWVRLKSVISHVLGDERLAAIEQSLGQSVEANIKDGIEGWGGRWGNPYQKLLIFFGPERAFDYMQSIFQKRVHLFTSPERLLEDMRQAHVGNSQYALVVEDHLTRVIATERAQPMSDFAAVATMRWSGGDTSRWQISEACLELLKDIAPDKAQALAVYNPIEKVFLLAQDIVCAPAAALRKIPDNDKERALRLLHHYKFAPQPVLGHVNAAIAAVSFASPLQPQRIDELNLMAESFLERMDKGALFELAARWPNMSLEEKMIPISEWHEQASDVFVLPNKRIELVDAGQLNEENDFSAIHGTHNYYGPIQLAVGSTISVTQIVGNLIHETLHQKHNLIERGLASPSSGLAGALFQAQYQTHVLDPRPTAGMDAEQERWAKKLGYVIYRTRISERESHYIGNYVTERLDLLMQYAQRKPAATYLIEDSLKTDVPLGKLLVLMGRQGNMERDVQAEEAAKFQILSVERPVFDIVVENATVRVDPFAAYPVQSDMLTLDHLKALHENGIEKVTVRFSKRQEHAFNALLDTISAYPLPSTAIPPEIPSLENVFGLPARNEAGLRSALALPAPQR